MKKLLDGLNPEQRLAVETTTGPVLVLAGAGTGKTRVITVRIAYLLSKRVLPENVLAMTFTNKAAGEMRERVSGFVGKKKAKELTIGTFHAFCLNALRVHGPKVGLPKRFSICDASDQLTAIKGALRELRIAETRIQPGALQSRISLQKNKLMDPERFLASPGDDMDELVGRAWKRYDEQLRRTASIDFDDMLLLTVKLLREQDDVRKAAEERFRYVMVDEYQDTNEPQYEIVRLIAGGHRNLCVVGDDDQSIYGWRGADVSKILGFENDFPGAVVVRLETNYRSREPILDAANKVIRNNPQRHEKALRSALGPGAEVQVRSLPDEMVEADQVTREIIDLVAREKAVYKEIAILFRTATQPRVFEEHLRARAIPYRLVGGMSFFDRKEVRDVLAYLRLVANPDDEVSLLRIINRPSRGIGKTTIDRLVAHATEKGVPVTHALQDAEHVEGIGPAAVEAIQGLREMLAGYGERDPGKQLVDWIRDLLEKVNYRAEVDKTYPDDKTREERWSTTSGILDLAENHVRRKKTPTLGTFLQDLTLAGEDSDDKPKDQDSVTLMTLHAAKGLEFPRVYLVGMEEGLLPHKRSVEEDSIEEERRLAYVGITRAQEFLTLTASQTRSKYGHRGPSMPSRFLYELTGRTPPDTWRAIDAPPDPVQKAEEAARKAKKKRKKRVRKVPPGAVRKYD
jgi:DNA helicase-2/ATP-dependent DNA helicase PcrA